MGYGSESRLGVLIPGEDLLDAIATQTAADKGTWTVGSAVTIYRFAVVVTTAITVAAAILALDRRPTPGSDTGREELARLTLPIGAAIGRVVYKDVQIDVEAGDQLVLELVQESTAGGVVPIIEHIPRSVMPSENADYLASA